MDKTMREILRQSNRIENVFDEQSLEDSIAAWEYIVARRCLISSIVLKTHRILMKNQPIEKKYKGQLRDVPVYVSGREGMKPEHLALALSEWVKEANKFGDPKVDHIKFEHIHPFIDGNGRIGRILLNYQRVKRGEEPQMIHGNKRGEYYSWFQG